jgi:RsiW-degrading membrane proteinase PrsW (M82 family)
MMANIPDLLFWALLIAMLVASFWWNRRRTRFHGGVKRYVAACLVHALFGYVAVVSAAVLTFENLGDLDKEHKIWIFAAIVMGSMILREIAKKLPVLGPLLIEFDNAAVTSPPPKTTERLEI